MTFQNESFTFIIADDHPLVLGGVRGVLENLSPGCRILEAESYPSLLETLQKEHDVSLIIADLNMPGMLGLEGIEAVQNKRPEVPLMIISATESQKAIDKTRGCGVAGYMFKSFGYKEMQRAIETVMEGETFFPEGRSDSLTSDEFSQTKGPDFGERTLNQLPMGVVIVNYSARVHFMNKQAVQLFAQNDGLEVGQDKILRAGRVESTKTLHGLIHDAARGTDNREGGAMTVVRPSFKRDFSLLVMPLPEEDGSFGAEEDVAVFINDPELHNEPPTKVLARLYDLTETEARVLQALIVGKNLDKVAEDFNVSLNTVRSHLKQVFRKTGTNRQPELVSLVLNSSAYLASTRVRASESDD